MTTRHPKNSLACYLVACLCGSAAAHASVALTNGSFESTGALYSSALGGLYEASGWTNLSGLNIQASSMPTGQEGTAGTADGSRVLRLVNDVGDQNPTNVGLIVQNLGSMVGGETYTFAADAFGGRGVNLAWGATAKFVNEGSATPAKTYASQTVESVAAGIAIADAFKFSYTAQSADNGLPLWIWLEAKPAGAGQATRGGIDHARLTVTEPAPASAILTFTFGSLGAATITGTDIAICVPEGTGLANLAPTFTLSPLATADPVSASSRDFTTPQDYVVTGHDGSSTTYHVKVTPLSSNLVVRDDGQSLHVDNGLVSLDLTRLNGTLTKTFSATDAAAQWQQVCSSFVPDFTAHPGGNPLFNSAVDTKRYRVHEMTASQYTITSASPTRVVIQVTGTHQGAQITETMELDVGTRYFHVRTVAVLPANSLDYCMSSYLFNHDGAPAFVHSPTVKKDETRWGNTPAANQVIGDTAFHSPAVVLQDGGLFVAMVPDLDSINCDKILSPDARRTQNVGATIYDIPAEADKFSMPTALDLNITSGLTAKPVFSYGMMDFIVSHHMHYQRQNDSSMVRALNSNTIAYGFDLLLGAQEPSNLGYQKASRHLWQKYGEPLFQSRAHLALPFEEYVKLVYGVVSQPMPPSVQAPVPGFPDHGVFLDFTMNNQPVCGMVAPLGVLGFGDALWNFEFWNPVRDASGMYYWGQKLGMPDMTTRARNIINLALQAPRNDNGLFCLTYLATSRQWLRGCVSSGAHSLFSKNNDTYDVPAMSKTAAHMIEYYKQCEQDSRIITYLTPYAGWLAAIIDANGRIPSYYTPAMVANDPFPINAQSAASMWFLAEMFSVTHTPAYLTAAQKIAGYLTQNVVPQQLWMDLEPYFSDGQNPLTFTSDPTQGLAVKGNLSTIWAAEGFASLYRATGASQYLTTGEQVVDYLSFSQACWHHQYVYTAFPFGGFTADNVDTATSLDARQCETVKSFLWYGQTLGRKDLLERGVAAARSGAVLINHPLHIANEIYAHPNLYGTGLGPENINHEGHNQSAIRSHPSWGECSAIFTGLANADRLMNGCYVDAGKPSGVGVNGLWCTNVSWIGSVLHIDLSSQLAALTSPWPADFATSVQVTGLSADTSHSIVINDLAPVISSGSADITVPLVVHANGTVSLANPYAAWTSGKLTAENNDPGQDPDNDGCSNLYEFAFNGDPLKGMDHGKLFEFTADSNDGTGRKLILTIAVRIHTPNFSGDPSPTASWDGITYIVEGSSTLNSYPVKVNALPSPVTTGLPAAGAGYEYRSFSLEGSSGLAGKGFLRAKVTMP